MAVYCCSDIHGNYNIFSQIKEFVKPEDKMIFLGDAADRKKDGYKIIKEILDLRNWIYLKGNHEDMLVKAVKNGPMSDAGFLCRYNGGESTLIDAINDPNREEIMAKLNDLPLYFCYTNSIGLTSHLTHAGYTPRESGSAFDNATIKQLLWDRDHFWDNCDYRPKEYKNSFIIHGHTPVHYLGGDIDYSYNIRGIWMGNKDHSPFIYANRCKIDIDAGTAYTGEAYVLNLDTFEFTLFKDTDKDGEDE